MARRLLDTRRFFERSDRTIAATAVAVESIHDPCETRTGRTFGQQMIFEAGALGGTRTPTILLTATSRQRVYQFRHERLGPVPGERPTGRRPFNKTIMQGQGRREPFSRNLALASPAKNASKRKT